MAMASGMHTLLWGPGSGACIVEDVWRHACSGESQYRQQGLGPTVGSLTAVEALAVGLYYFVCWVSPQWRCVGTQLDGLAEG